MGFVFKGIKNELETVVVNEPSVLEPLKVYCMLVESSVRGMVSLRHSVMMQKVPGSNQHLASQQLENFVNPAVNEYLLYQGRIRQQKEKDGLCCAQDIVGL